MNIRSTIRTGLTAALVLTAFVASCTDETGPATALDGRLAVAPVFAGAGTGAIEIVRIRFLLVRVSDESVARDTVIDVAAGQDSIDLALTVPVLSVGERFLLTLSMIDAAGDTVFQGGPIEVSPTTSGGTPPPIQIPVVYVGVGANAVAVVITPTAAQTLSGEEVLLTAEALDDQDVPIPGTPVVWSALDPAQATVPSPDTGRVVGGTTRGTARIVAELLTGPRDTANVAVQPLPSAIAAESGGGQTASIGAALPQPLVARVTAPDGLGVAGLPIVFTVVSGGGMVSVDTVLSDAQGRGSAMWTLGSAAGAQAVDASTPRLPGTAATFTATAVGVLSVASGDGQTGTVGAALTQPLVALVEDASANPVAGVQITWAVTQGSGSVGPTNSVTDANGLASTTFTLGTVAGSAQEVTASIGGGTGVTFGATAQPGPATALAFVTQPSAAGANATITPPVEVELLDAFGNRVTTDNTTAVDIAITSGTGTPGAALAGTTTQPAAAGLVTFADLSIDLGGAGYTLDASIPSLALATSTPFDITALPMAVTWTNAAGGNWSTGANWSTGTVPGPNDTVVIDLAGTYTVTLDQPDTVSAFFLGGASGTQSFNDDGVPGGALLGVTDTANIRPNGVFRLIDGFNADGAFVIDGRVEIGDNHAGATGVTLVGPGGTLALHPALGGGTLFFIQRTLQIAGTLDWDKAVTLSLLSASVEIQSGGLALWSGNAAVMAPSSTGPFGVTNAGTFLVTAAGMSVTSPFINQSGGVLEVSTGTILLSGDLTHAAGAVLRGAGTVNVTNATVLAFDGAVNPGTSPGILTILGDYAPGAASVLNIELGGTSAGSGYDRLDVTGTITAGGTLAIDTINGFVPAPNDTFAILTYGARTGDVANVTLPTIGGVLIDTVSTTGQSPDTLYVVVSSSSTATQWINGAGGNWSTGANWSTGVAPGAADSVVIDLAGMYTVTLDVPATVAYLTLGGASGNQTLAVGGNTLTVDNVGVVNALGILSIAGGTVMSATGTLTIDGGLAWAGGTLSVGGGLTIGAGGSAQLTTAAMTLGAGTLSNFGLIGWSAGDLTLAAGTALINEASGTITSTGNTLLNAPGTFTNLGSFFKAAGTFVSLIAPTVNDGVMVAQTGTIGFGNTGTFTHAGEFFLSSGTGAEFAFGGTGTHTLDSAVSGLGTLSNSNADLFLNGSVFVSYLVVGAFADITVNGPIDVTDSVRVGRTLTLNGSLLNTPFVRMVDGSSGIAGSADLEVTDSLAWGGGAMSGSGTTTVLFGAVMRIAPVGQAAINGTAGRTVINEGTTIWTAGDLGLQNGATFTNEFGATFDMQGDLSLVESGGVGTFVNAGTFLKTGGTGTGSVAPTFQNTGTLSIQSGTLDLNGSYTHAVGAVLEGTGALDIVDAPVITFDGAVNPGTSPGTLTVVGDLNMGLTSVFNVELDGTTPGSFDRWDVSGDLGVNGVLNVNASFTPLAGDSFTVLTFVARGGTFPSVAGVDLGGGVTLDTVWLPTELALVARTPPQFVVFSGDSAGGLSSGIFSVNGDGTGLGQITPEGPPASTMTNARWSPDRTRITYSANPGIGENQLHIAAADGSIISHPTSAGDTSTYRPRFNSTGQRIAFECGDQIGRDDDVCTIADVSGPIATLDGIGDDAVGGKVYLTDLVETQIDPAIKEGPSSFAWNPLNPDQLAFFRDSISAAGDTVSHLIISDFDGSGMTNMTPSGLSIGQGPLIVANEIDWSPDGSLIAFAARERGQFENAIFVIAPDGTGLQRVATDPGIDLARPVSSPDGSTILFAAFVDGFEIRNVPSNAVDDVGITMTPLLNFNFAQAGYDWSPDGSEIVINEDFTTTSTIIVKIKPSTTQATFAADVIVIGRLGQTFDEVFDQQPSWRP